MVAPIVARIVGSRAVAGGAARQSGRVVAPRARPAPAQVTRRPASFPRQQTTLEQMNNVLSRAPNYTSTAPKTKKHVGTITAAFMVGIALLFDLLQFLFSMLHVIPLIGTQIAVGVAWFIAVLALGIFGIWFTLLGVKYFTGKQVVAKLFALFGPLAFELVPLISALPAITGGVVATILISRYEDGALGNNLLSGVLPFGRAADLLSGKK